MYSQPSDGSNVINITGSDWLLVVTRFRCCVRNVVSPLQPGFDDLGAPRSCGNVSLHA